MNELTDERIREIVREVHDKEFCDYGFIDWPPGFEVALSRAIEREVLAAREAESFAISAAVCVHPKGVYGDEGGSPCCPITHTRDAKWVPNAKPVATVVQLDNAAIPRVAVKWEDGTGMGYLYIGRNLYAEPVAAQPNAEVPHQIIEDEL